jgi:hypothetical protein
MTVHNPEDQHRILHRRENLKSHIKKDFVVHVGHDTILKSRR